MASCRCCVAVRYSASVDDLKAKTCFDSLLNSLEEEWGRCVKDNNILQGPDLPGIKEYLLVGQTLHCHVAAVL